MTQSCLGLVKSPRKHPYPIVVVHHVHPGNGRCESGKKGLRETGHSGGQCRQLDITHSCAVTKSACPLCNTIEACGVPVCPGMNYEGCWDKCPRFSFGRLFVGLASRRQLSKVRYHSLGKAGKVRWLKYLGRYRAGTDGSMASAGAPSVSTPPSSLPHPGPACPLHSGLADSLI